MGWLGSEAARAELRFPHSPSARSPPRPTVLVGRAESLASPSQTSSLHRANSWGDPHLRAGVRGLVSKWSLNIHGERTRGREKRREPWLGCVSGAQGTPGRAGRRRGGRSGDRQPPVAARPLTQAGGRGGPQLPGPSHLKRQSRRREEEGGFTKKPNVVKACTYSAFLRLRLQLICTE